MSRCRFAVLLATCLAAAGVASADPAPLTLYSAQHEQMVDQLTAGFTKATGIPVRVRSGEPPEIANQLVQEGSATPADVFFTANSPELVLLDEKGLLAPVDAATLALVPHQFSAPDGSWVGVLAREDVLAFNPKLIHEAELPASLLDLAHPAWKGRIAIAPTDADFLPLVGAVVALHGKAAALDWLRGLKRNAQVFDDNEAVMVAVDRGTAATGIINNYYWARLRAEVGAEKLHSAIHHFGHADVGALINVSGAAVLKASHNPEAAQKFLAYLVSAPAQKMLADGDISYEYPLTPGVAPNPLLTPMGDLQPPPVSAAQLGDDQQAADLLREAGLI